MKAIVLSYDRNHFITDHMIRQYNRLWPDNPFIYRVPFQDYPVQLKNRYLDKIELIQSPPDIKKTLLTLIADLPDDEWVYWCIDDKYPVVLDIEVASALYRYVSNTVDKKIQGVLFCRCRKLLDGKQLRRNSEIYDHEKIQLVERKSYHQFWIHQYMRVGVLRNIFNEFPDREFRAKEMDVFTGQQPGHEVKLYDLEQKMYVTSINFSQFGESTSRGLLTKNCYESMMRIGMEPPESIPVSDKLIIMG